MTSGSGSLDQWLQEEPLIVFFQRDLKPGKVEFESMDAARDAIIGFCWSKSHPFYVRQSKSQGKKTKTGKKVTNKHSQGITSEEYYVLADGTNGVVAPPGALPGAAGTAPRGPTTRRKETRPRVCSKCLQPGHNAHPCRMGRQQHQEKDSE